MKTNLSLNSMNRHRLIDCGEYISNMLAKKAVTTRTSDTNHQRKVTLPSSSASRQNFSNDGIQRRSTAIIRQNRLKSLLAKDIPQ